jgi:hypothetical protein
MMPTVSQSNEPVRVETLKIPSTLVNKAWQVTNLKHTGLVITKRHDTWFYPMAAVQLINVYLSVSAHT